MGKGIYMKLSDLLFRGVLLSSALMFLISCAEEEADVTVTPSPATIAEAPPVYQEERGPSDSFEAGYFQVSVQEKPQPNSYEVQVAWKSFKGFGRILIDGKVIDVFDEDQSSFSYPVQGGQVLKVKIEGKKDTWTTFESKELAVEVPKDLLVERSWTLTENTNIQVNRVFLLGGATITTLNHNLQIQAKNLLVEGGVIQNFPLSAKAATERNGRSGGIISIVSDKAQGRLGVRLSGEHGGDGKKGVVKNPMVPGSLSCVGTSGGHGGNTGALVVKINDGGNLQINVEKSIGEGGVGGLKGLLMGDPNDYVNFPCDIHAPPGISGNSGLPGESCVQRFAGQTIVCK